MDVDVHVDWQNSLQIELHKRCRRIQLIFILFSFVFFRVNPTQPAGRSYAVCLQASYSNTWFWFRTMAKLKPLWIVLWLIPITQIYSSPDKCTKYPQNHSHHSFYLSLAALRTFSSRCTIIHRKTALSGVYPYGHGILTPRIRLSYCCCCCVTEKSLHIIWGFRQIHVN